MCDGGDLVLGAAVQPFLDGEEEGGAWLSASGEDVVEGDLHAADRTGPGEVAGEVADGALGAEGRGQDAGAPVIEESSVRGNCWHDYGNRSELTAGRKPWKRDL